MQNELPGQDWLKLQNRLPPGDGEAKGEGDANGEGDGLAAFAPTMLRFINETTVTETPALLKTV